MQISNIDVSLRHGNLLDKKQLVILYIAMLVSLLIPLLTLVLLIVPGVEWDNQMISALVIANIMFISFSVVLIFIMIKNKKLRKKVDLCMEDAIKIKAYSKKMGENKFGFQPKAVKIRVKFQIGDKVYTRESTAKVFGGQKGYLGCYTKHADREINILYSPKYDEVLILKRNK